MADQKIGLLDAEFTDLVNARAMQLAAEVGFPADALVPLLKTSRAVQVVDKDSIVVQGQALNAQNATFKIIVRDDLLEPVTFFLKVTKGCAALSGGVAALLALGSSVATVGALAAALADLYDVFKKIWDQTHRLDEAEWAIVSELATAKRATIDELAKNLPAFEMTRILAVLTKFKIGEGKPKHNFVLQDGDYWELTGV